MKKGLIVLLIAVLASGFAFAGSFHGSAGITFGVDFDDQSWGFANPKFGKYSFEFALDTTPVEIGADHQTDVWAELKANAEASIKMSTAAATNDLSGGAALDPGARYSAAITVANIHVGDITFGILNAGSAINLAKSYYKAAANGNKVWDVVAGKAFLANGFTVSYKDWKGGFGAEGTWGDNAAGDTYKIFAHVETPTFKFADEQVSVLGGAYAYATDETTNASQFGGAAKAAYKADKLSADAEVDLAYAAEEFAYEAAANATYDFVTLNVYLAKGSLVGYADEDPLKLDAKLSAKYKFDLNEDIALDVTGYVEARDTLVEALVLYAGSTQATKIDKLGVALAEDLEIDNLANDNDVAIALDLSADVTYTEEKFEAYAGVTASFDFSAEDALAALGFQCGISSEAIVEGAVLALDYVNNYAKATKIAFKDTKGAVTASCTINF